MENLGSIVRERQNLTAEVEKLKSQIQRLNNQLMSGLGLKPSESVDVLVDGHNYRVINVGRDKKEEDRGTALLRFVEEYSDSTDKESVLKKIKDAKFDLSEQDILSLVGLRKELVATKEIINWMNWETVDAEGRLPQILKSTVIKENATTYIEVKEAKPKNADQPSSENL